MGYESLSTVIVLVIVVLMLAVWLPRRTVNGMKHVMEHREDRYSSSLHLVDADSGTKFSDVRTPQAKGAIMQPSQPHKAMSAAEHIAQVRRMRREAARRRAVIAGVLAAATVVVIVLAVVLRFSPLLALIPGGLLLAVLGLGVNAARHARAWERKVAERRARRSQAKPVQPVVQARERDASAAPTEAMEQREIRRALRESEEEKARVQARREARRADVVDVDSVVVEERTDDDRIVMQRDDARNDDVPHAEASHAENEQAVPADATTELDEVRPARALDAFEVAASQDLISFTLGEPRNGFDVRPEAPESLEIRSARQVAKAVPVEEEPADAQPQPAAQEEPAAQDAQDDVADSEGVSFHDAEVSAQVEAPVATSESLGTGLDTILARRGA